MKKFAIAISAITALGCASSANAADLPLKAPAVAAPVAYSWTGFYIGGHLGGGWERSGTGSAADPLITIPFAPVSFGTNQPAAFLGGGQIGYNYQFNRNWVIGIEADATWTRLNANGSSGVNFPAGFGGGPLANSIAQVESKVDWLASIRGRLGYAWDNWLVYATGGYAWGGFKYSGNFTCPFAPCVGVPPAGLVAPGSSSATEHAWVLGAGAQWKPTEQPWSLGLEYLYYAFNNTRNFTGAELNAATGAQVSFGGCAGAVPCNLNYSVKDAAIQVVRARLDWKF